MPDFDEVQRREHEMIEVARDRVWEPHDTERPRRERDHAALAFSGGGIRSATFNLGVLQGLAELDLLKRFDYLSTVSGGGYIGAWLTAHTKRAPEGLTSTCEALAPPRSGQGDGHSRPAEARSLRWLRQYSNYLTPQLGLFSLDTVAFIGSYFRNLTLNLLVLTAVFAAALLMPRVLGPAILGVSVVGGSRLSETAAVVPGSAWVMAWLGARPEYLLVAALLGWLALAITLTNVRQLTSATTEEAIAHRFATPTVLLVTVIGPLMLAAYLGWRWVAAQASETGRWGAGRSIVWGVVAYAAVWALGWATACLVERFWAPRGPGAAKNPSQAAAPDAQAPVMLDPSTPWPSLLRIIGYAAVAGAGGGTLMWALSGVPDVLGFPAVVGIFLATETLHIGFVGRDFSEEVREWWGRLGGLLTQCAVLAWVWWVVVWYAPIWVHQGLALLGAKSDLATVVTTYGLPALWAGLTGGGVWAGQSSKTANGGGNKGLEILAQAAPWIFIVGFAVMLSVALEKFSHQMLRDAPSQVALVVVALVAFSWLLSHRMGVNEFSMHALYRNRLVRCFLGASNRQRRAHPFTGFDPQDDVELAACGNVRPYHLINAALNLVTAENLAWQQRKAASFVLSPVACGYDFFDARDRRVGALSLTAHAAEPPTIGLAVAISGAAASPNMGYHTSSLLSFLLTIFNVRLGWWMANPRDDRDWKGAKPNALRLLLSELLGQTNARNSAVYLSDGGHFENLGVYELVRRRCRFIVACDSGQDGGLTFSDLGNAIEKCRADFGVDIEIDSQILRPPAGSKVSPRHCVIGRIRYDQVDPTRVPGTILYVKSTLTGDEPADVLRYAAEAVEFPHQSTSDQWFDESQFESYRMLGYHVVTSIFAQAGSKVEFAGKNLHEIFAELEQAWYPPLATTREHTKHTAVLNALWEELHHDGQLRFLDGQIFPEWPHLMSDVTPPKYRSTTGWWLPDSEGERRAGFYFSAKLIQLMEDVYVDLDLEHTLDHPDNRGWMNLFQHWAWSGMVAATWSITASTYGARFQRFCKRRLDLRTGWIYVDSGGPLAFGEDERQWPALLEQSEQIAGLNFWERHLLGKFLELHKAQERPGESRFPLYLFPLRLVRQPPDATVFSDASTTRPDEVGDRDLSFVIGFALAQPLDEEWSGMTLWFMRIQNHLRTMGLGREALLRLQELFPTALPAGDRAVKAWMTRPATAEGEARPLQVSRREGAALEEAAPRLQDVERVRALLDSVRHGRP